MKLNIQQKLIIFTCCLVFLAGIAGALLSIYEGRKQVMATFTEQSRGVAQILADALVEDIHFKNVAALTERIRATLALPSVVHVNVFDSAGNLLYSGDKAKTAKLLAGANSLPHAALSGEWKATLKGSLLRVGGPVANRARNRATAKWRFSFRCEIPVSEFPPPAWTACLNRLPRSIARRRGYSVARDSAWPSASN